MKAKDRKSVLSLYVSTKLISLLDIISDRHKTKVSKLAEKLIIDSLQRDGIDTILDEDSENAIEKITAKIIERG
jgi:hypothetical protein